MGVVAPREKKIHQVMKGLSFLFNDAESSSNYTDSYYTMISQSNGLERKRTEAVVT